MAGELKVQPSSGFKPTTNHVPSPDPQWSVISTKLLLAELQRRKEDGERPACGSKETGWYDTAAHVFALLLILTLSTLGMMSPGSRELQATSVQAWSFGD